MAVQRVDLIDRLKDKTYLFNNHRICGRHFEKNMIGEGKRNLLKKNAIPSIFVSNEGLSKTRGIYRVDSKSPTDERVNKASVSSDLNNAPTPQSSASPIVYSFGSNSQSTQTVSPLYNTVSLQTPQQLLPRKNKLTKDTEDLRLEIEKLKRENRVLIAKNKNLLFRLSDIPNEITLEDYQQLTYKFCPYKEVAEFINVQIAQINKTPKGRRYSAEFKHKCLSMYFAGPKLYKSILSKLFCLPSAQTLQNLLKGLDICVGLDNPNIFETLKIKTKNFSEQDKLCVLCVDEMNIKANIFYDRGKDTVIGLEDCGNSEKVFKPAKTATVLMLRGIRSNWKQPLSYFFYNTTCPGAALKKIIFDAIQKLKEIGLIVSVVISDMGSNNIQLKNLLQITPEHPYFFC